MSNNSENNKRIEVAKNQLLIYLNNLDIDNLPISSYSKKYLFKYQSNSFFFINHYTQIFKKAISKINKPLNEINVLDYGGGCGLMSFLAVLSNVKSIIYNDIFETSTQDAQIISKSLDINIDYFVTGNINEVVNFILDKQIEVDLIVSIDVLEHIYDLENWFQQLVKLPTPFTLYFNTGANSKNPLINRRLMKYQQIAEKVGKEKSWGWKERDSYESFLNVRKEIIKNHPQNLSEADIEMLAQKSRGLIKVEIEQLIDLFIKTGIVNYVMKHPTNTCDPITGNWTEHLIDLEEFLNMLNKIGYSAVIENNNYVLSNNFIKDFFKLNLNFLMCFLKKDNLFFSPTFSLIVKNF
jgi:2-polyprenyl-3-methyl-5-hydroxy-6-metoxy-1,4-benzoquinol methylase